MRTAVVTFGILLALILVLVSCVEQPAIVTPNPAVPENEKPAEHPKIEQAKPLISPEVRDLLSMHKTRVQSVSYKYKGPESGDFLYDFYVKGQKIKYSPQRDKKYFDKEDSYNYIFIDKANKTAESYCLQVCPYPGKKGDLNYDGVYVSTILDWIDEITSAEKVGEEALDNRNTWKLDTNKGIFWVDTFYGVPLKVESSGKTYRFYQVAVNSVTDADTNPS